MILARLLLGLGRGGPIPGKGSFWNECGVLQRGRYIDFISAYCDRWCQRCGFTTRCSSHAVQVALEMCDGNFEEAVELAIGAPPPRTEAEVKRREAVAAEIASIPEPRAVAATMSAQGYGSSPRTS